MLFIYFKNSPITIRATGVKVAERYFKITIICTGSVELSNESAKISAINDGKVTILNITFLIELFLLL